MLLVTKLKVYFAIVMALMGISVTSEGLLTPIIVKAILTHPNANPFVHFSKSPLDLTGNILESEASEVKSVLDGVGALLALFLNPLMGGVSDKYGRKPILLVAMFFLMADYVLLSISYWQSWLWCMLLAKVAGSFGMTHIALCGAYMSDLFPAAERAKAFGIVSASIGVGLALGPSTVGYFGRNNFYIGLGIGLGSVTAAFIFMCFLRESLHYPTTDQVVISIETDKPFDCSLYANPFKTLSVILTRDNMYLTGLSIVFMLYSLAVTDVTSTFVLFTNYRYDWNLLQIGLCDSYLGVLMCFNQGVMLRLYEKHLGLRKMLVSAFIISTFSHLLYAFAYKWWLFIIGLFVSSGGFVGHPAIQALITNAEDPAKRGAVLGALGALQALCSLAGGVINDNLFAYFISGKAFTTFSGPQFFLGSFLFAMAAFSSLWLFRVYSDHDVAQRQHRVYSDHDVAQRQHQRSIISGSVNDEDAKPLLASIEDS